MTASNSSMTGAPSSRDHAWSQIDWQQAQSQVRRLQMRIAKAVASVIASHANEEATKDGKLIEGTRTETFINAVDMEVHVPLSGVEMHFNQEGVCTEGCG